MKYETIDHLIEDKYKKVTREIVNCLNDFINRQFDKYISNPIYLELYEGLISQQICLCMTIDNFKIKIKVNEKKLEYESLSKSTVFLENLTHVEKIEIDEKWCNVRFILLKKLAVIIKENGDLKL